MEHPRDGRQRGTGPARAAIADYLLFDLDNTLYPRSSGLGLEINRLMTAFVAEHLGAAPEEAASLRRSGFRTHGTTLRWLVEEHGLSDVEGYLEAVHPADLSPWITPADGAAARAVFDRIDLPVSILTNGPIEHAERVLDRLGLSGRFEHIFDLRGNGFVGKPAREAYTRTLERLGVEAKSTLFVDDVIEYLLPFQELGGTAVLLGSAPAGCPVVAVETLIELLPIIYPGRSAG